MMSSVISILIHIFQAGSWHDITDTIIKDPILIIDLFLRFFYLSVSTATLCGKLLFRWHPSYSVVGESLQGIFFLVGGNKIKFAIVVVIGKKGWFIHF